MTYLQFHLLFLAPPLLVMALALRRRGPGRERRARWALPLLALIAFVYTTPWDNYLVARGVWSYGTERVIGTIGYVPIEEYLFFLLQPFLVGLWFLLVPAGTAEAAPASGRGAPGIVAIWLSLTGAGALMLTQESTTYLGLILVWACPVLAAQALLAGATLRRMRRRVVLGVSVPVLYLWVADAIAIRLGIWAISERYTTGIALLGLPLEEAVFFLLTTLLVVQGLVLFLHPAPARRAPRSTATAGADA